MTAALCAFASSMANSIAARLQSDPFSPTKIRLNMTCSSIAEQQMPLISSPRDHTIDCEVDAGAVQSSVAFRPSSIPRPALGRG
jgi:hypothetical protein